MSKRIWCFNPHTHEGCDSIYNSLSFCDLVSIHTPTKGVTDSVKASSGFTRVSIHTPTKGVTAFLLNRPYISCVSIHTPTKGVTSRIASSLVDSQFQSTHPRRV